MMSPKHIDELDLNLIYSSVRLSEIFDNKQCDEWNQTAEAKL